jgi:hypothetical protein
MAEGARNALSAAKEATLVNEVRVAAYFHRGVSFKAFLQFARKCFPNETTHTGVNWTASPAWGYEFIRRHSLRLHNAQPVEAGDAYESQEIMTRSVWQSIDDVISQYRIVPSALFNLDESRLRLPGSKDDVRFIRSEC